MSRKMCHNYNNNANVIPKQLSKMELDFGSEIPHVDVVIVGAGLSGLTTAVKILAKEKSLSVQIIDENIQVGGQLSYIEDTDIVAKWINEDQDQTISFMNIMHVPPFRRMSPTSRLARCWDLDCGLSAEPAKYELNRYLHQIEIRMEQYRPGRVRLSKKVSTIKQHIENNLFFSKSRLFMLNLVELTCGVNPDEVNYDEFMSVCSTCGGVLNLVDLYFNVPNTLYEVSAKELLSNIKERIKYADTRLNTRVREIKHFKNYVELVDSNEEICTAEAVVLAIPWNQIKKIKFTPDIPQEFQKSSRRNKSTPRKVTTFGVRYNKSWWGSRGYSGSYLCSSPLIIGQEFRPLVYAGVTVHNPGEEVTVRSLVLAMLAKSFGPEMLEPQSYNQMTFELSEAISYPQTVPWHRVIWSSSAAASTYYRNHLGGAIQSGLRAAMNALFIVRPQVVSWRDLMDLEQRNPYASKRPSWLELFLSRFNLYNVTYYGLFIIGLVFLLDRTYQRHPT